MSEIHNQLAQRAVRNPIHIKKDTITIFGEFIIVFFDNTEDVSGILLCQTGHQQVEVVLVFVRVNTSHLYNSRDGWR
jgi:hypothetical protein